MKLSIITVTMNNAANLKRTLGSVASQTYKEFEQIVVDGNSKDESVSVIKSYEGKIANYRWVSELDKGIYDAMNKGIRMANGEYCLFLNAGDILYEDNVLSDLFSSEPEKDIVSCNSIYEKSKFHNEQIVISPDVITPERIILSFLPHQATLIRTSLFHAIHEYDTSFKVVSDWLFFIEALLKHKASYQHIQLFLSSCEMEGVSSNPANNELMDSEFHEGLKKVLPELYDEYAEKHREKLARYTETTTKTYIKILSKITKHIGYYPIKAAWRKKQECRKLVREDNAKKKEVRAAISALPENLLANAQNKIDVVVSLTSYGKRVTDSLPYALYSLLTQSVLPEQIVVYLDKKEWSDANLPTILLQLQVKGVLFRYVEDIKSYKKLIPALKEFSDKPIITVDDDFYYNEKIIEWLMDAYEQSDKKTVIGSWGCMPVVRNGKYAPYTIWQDCKYGNEKSEYSLFAGNGTVYPPQVFDVEICKKEVFMKLCPTADDIWFWVQEKRLGVKTQLISNAGYGLHVPVNRVYTYNPNQPGTLFYENGVQGKNDEQLKAVLEHYAM